MTLIDDADLPESRRTLDKQEALRHLIHTAIRLLAEMEDPFAIHLLVHSADKILIDLSKKSGHELRIDWELYIKDEYHKQFFSRYREIYNYFKHADRDFATDLPVRDVAITNVMNIFAAVINYAHMFREYTHHMVLFVNFVFALMPGIIVPTDTRGIELLKGVHDIQSMTPADFFRAFKEHPEVLPKFRSEAAKDVEDLKDFYHLTFRELREGRRKSQRFKAG